MGWETYGSGRYYYRKVWRNGTCVSEYVGNGLGGWLADHDDSMTKHARNMERAEHYLHAEQDKMINEYGATVKALTTAILLASGCHQHKRQWRVRRGE